MKNEYSRLQGVTRVKNEYSRLPGVRGENPKTPAGGIFYASQTAKTKKPAKSPVTRAFVGEWVKKERRHRINACVLMCQGQRDKIAPLKHSRVARLERFALLLVSSPHLAACFCRRQRRQGSPGTLRMPSGLHVALI